ncbi:MAG: hypothetical protein GY845_29560 [Planctomycetes bacterium]|nr:hypothetical protein [Planctomycetota bacterium]
MRKMPLDEYNEDAIKNMPDYDAIIVGALVTEYAIENGFTIMVNKKHKGKVLCAHARKPPEDADEESQIFTNN